MKIDIGIFAYNEQGRVRNIITDLSKQTILGDKAISPRFYLLANGCTDETVREARQAISELPNEIADVFHVLDLDIKGKSRTWNYFVHSKARDDADSLLFVDADIRIPQENHIELMLSLLNSDAHRVVITSRPVKDISANPESLNALEKLIAALSGTATNYKASICGQMYLVKSAALREIYMPAGLPVEDGFIRAMLLTRSFSEQEDLRRITGDESIYHTYESLRTVRDLIRHQTRIVIGSAINTTVFGYINREHQARGALKQELSASANDPQWLQKRLDEALPTYPYGYVPFSFLTKRIRKMAEMNSRISAGLVVRTTIGLAFDSIVYVFATYKMARGSGAGYW